MRLHSAVVITTTQRPDRLAAFVARWEAAHLDPALLRVLAVDMPAALPDRIASLWRAHLSALRDGALHEVDAPASRTDRVHVVFEDDAVVPWNVAAQMYLIKPPRHWDVIVLGGRYLSQPGGGGLGLCRPRHLRGSHAYAVREGSRLAVAARLQRMGPRHVDVCLSHLGEVYGCAPTWIPTDPELGSDLGHERFLRRDTRG